MIEAVKRWTGEDFDLIKTDEEAQKIAEKYELKIEGALSWGKVLSEMFEKNMWKNIWLTPFYY